MMILSIEGATKRVGNLPILEGTTDTGIPMMGSAWEPTPEELDRLCNGAPIYLWVFGTAHPPVGLTVGAAP